jgi:hypothetical protein
VPCFLETRRPHVNWRPRRAGGAGRHSLTASRCCRASNYGNTQAWPNWERIVRRATPRSASRAGVSSGVNFALQASDDTTIGTGHVADSRTGLAGALDFVEADAAASIDNAGDGFKALATILGALPRERMTPPGGLRMRLRPKLLRRANPAYVVSRQHSLSKEMPHPSHLVSCAADARSFGHTGRFWKMEQPLPIMRVN